MFKTLIAAATRRFRTADADGLLFAGLSAEAVEWLDEVDGDLVDEALDFILTGPTTSLPAGDELARTLAYDEIL